MAKAGSRWVRVRKLQPAEKAAIAARCDRLIADVLLPKYLPVIRPTQFNYPIGILGRWRGHRYSFITQYRSGFEDNRGDEFESAFTRLDHCEEIVDDLRFDVMWHRHTGQWWPIERSLTLDDAIRTVETKGILHPPI